MSARIDTSPEAVARIIARERHRPFPYSVEGLETASLLDALAAERDAALAKRAESERVLARMTVEMEAAEAREAKLREAIGYLIGDMVASDMEDFASVNIARAALQDAAK